MEIGGSSTAKQNNSRSQGKDDRVSVNVTALTSSMKEEFKQLHPFSEERCIYRVPQRLKVLYEKAYTPQCVSVGPYHHGKEELKAMEEIKTLYLQHFLGYTKVSLHEYFSCVRDNEAKLRRCYHERIDLSSERFVRLVLVDAAFVIMFMLRVVSNKFDDKDDPARSNAWMIGDIGTDIILLENQLPFFILDQLLILSHLSNSSLDLGHSIPVVSQSLSLNLSFHFCHLRFRSWPLNLLEGFNVPECAHLVDILRIGQQPLVRNMRYSVGEHVRVGNLPTAAELHRAGVKFKCGSSPRLVDINFRDGILEIPVLNIVKDSQFLFRNVQAFEQVHVGRAPDKYFNDYISMIGFLVKSEEDAEILIQEGIIRTHVLGNEQVVDLFLNLNKENSFYKSWFYFTDVVNELTKHCRKRRNRWRASLIQNYFNTPWSIISIIAAVYIILLTTIQTLCSILQV